MKFYSKTTNGFYDSRIHKKMPADVVTITEAEHKQLLQDQSAGGIITPDADGKPTIRDAAPSRYHKWNGSAYVLDATKRQPLIKELEKQIDAQTDKTILTGFIYDGNAYYLSLENQMNFKGLNDIRDTLTYPVKVKHQDGYAMIANASDYHTFYLAGLAFKQLTIETGWNEKDELQDKTTEELIQLLNT